MGDISYGEVCLDALINSDKVAQNPSFNSNQAINVKIYEDQTNVKALEDPLIIYSQVSKVVTVKRLIDFEVHVRFKELLINYPVFLQ